MIKLPDDVMQSIEAVAKLNNDLYRWTSRMSYNGSWVGEPEGFIKGHIREMEKILDHLRAEVQRLNATAQPVSDGWVRCSERMPLEKSGKIDEIVVLVTDGNSVGMAACYSGGLPKPWVSFSSYGDVHGTDITHWMPLPAAPGGQDI